MAGQDHHVRVILESLVRGSNNLRRFFADAEKDIKTFRKSVREAGEEVDLVFTGSGIRGRGASGRFLPVQVGEVEKAILRLRDLRRAAQDVNKESSQFGQFFKAFAAGREENVAIRKAFEDRVNLSKEAAQKAREELDRQRFGERQSLDAHHFAVREDIERSLITEIQIESAAQIRKLRDQANYYQDRIDARRKAAIKEGMVVSQLEESEDRKASQRIRSQIIRLERERDAEIRVARERLRSSQQVERQEFDLETKRKRQQITQPDVSQIFADTRRELEETHKEVDKLDSRLTRFGRNAGRSLSSFRTGIALGRQELSDSDRQFLRTEGRLTRLGVAFGAATRGAAGFVNVKWAIVISFLQIFGTLLVQGGTALVALASSLIQAGAALGGAFLAGLTQVVPIIGLLSAAFSRLGTVLDAAKLSEKLRLTAGADEATALDAASQAAQRASDARYALVKAGEAVKDAEFELKQSALDVKDAYKDQREAIEDLADARKDAAKDIVDANLEEKEAALSLEEAELAVLDAKRRLREERDKDVLDKSSIADAQAQVREAQDRLAQVRKEGDAAEISVALQQLSIAEQNLQQINNQVDETGNRIKDAELSVQRSEINVQQAKIRNQRAQEDAARLRREGIEGSDRVKSAQERVAQATRSIADAQRRQVLATRALRDAIHGAAIAARSEAEARKSVADATSKQTAQQEQLQQALSDLSPTERRLFRSLERIKERYREIFRPITDIITGAFARAVDRAAILLEDPKLQRAAKLLATAIGGAIDTISRFTLTPEFKRFLEFSINEAAKNIPILTRAFLNLFRVFMRIAQAAGPLLNRLFERFEKFTERIEQRTRSREGIEKFFSVAERHLGSWLAFVVAATKLLAVIVKLAAPSGKTLIDSLTEKLNEWTTWLNNNEERVSTFFKNIAADVQALTATLALAVKTLFVAFSSEQASALTKFILEVFIPAFTLFIDILGRAAQLFIALTNIPFIGELLRLVAVAVVTEKLFNRLIPATQKLTNLFFALATGGFRKFLDGLAREFPAVSRAFNEIVLRMQIAMIGLRDALLKTAIAQRILNSAALANPYVRAAIIITTILIPALIALELKFGIITKAIKSVEKIFREAFNWIKQNWKLLTVIILAPFIGIPLALIKFKDSIIGAAQAVISFFNTRWGRILIATIVAPFVAIPLAAYEFGRDLIQGLIDGVVSKATDLKNKIIDIVKSPWEAVKSFFGIFSPSTWTAREIGQPLAEGITEGAKEGMRGAGTELTLALRNELRSVEQEAIAVRNRMLSQISGLRSMVSSQLGLRLQELTPAEIELQKLDQAETERGRKQQIAEAGGAVKQAQAEVDKANKEVVRKQKAFNNAKTGEQKRQAREELKLAKQAQIDAKRQLEEAGKQLIEVERQIGVDRKRERLNALAQEQREELEKTVAREQNRADKLITAFANALKGEPNKFKIQRARSILDQIMGLIGGGREGGKKAANEYVAGFLGEFNKFKGQLAREEKAVTRKGQILAQQNKQAGQLLAASTQQPLISSLTTSEHGQAKTDLETLQFLIATGKIDLALAEEIVGITSDDIDLTIIKKMMKNIWRELDYDNVRKLFRIQKSQLSPNNRLLAILNQIDPEERTLGLFANALKGIKLFQSGGQVGGGAGQPVPIVAHAGEWILNKGQQAKLAQSLGMGLEQIKMWLFGTNMGQGKPGPQTTGTKPTTKEQGFRGAFFNLVPQVDPDGVVVWFIEMDDGAFGQVSPKDARRIKASDGNWIPGYVKRSTHGFTQKFLPPQLGRGLASGGVVQKFLKGGVIMPGFAGPMLQSFAEGGTVLQQTSFGSPSSTSNKTVEQHFNVTAQGETDWNYILRMGAIHAQA